MTEPEFLSVYRPEAFDPFAVTADLVLMTIEEGALRVLLVSRAEHPAKGLWSLPGGFVGANEELDAAARRILRQKARLRGIAVEQLQTFGAVKRDPRMRIISVAYFALVPNDALAPALKGKNIMLADASAAGTTDHNGKQIKLAFDHDQIVQVALARLRGKLDYSDVAFRLLPAEFTLFDLQKVHETILGRPVNKPAFRKRMEDSGLLKKTDNQTEGSKFRPAFLYRYIGERAASHANQRLTPTPDRPRAR